MSCQIKRILQFQTAIQYGELRLFNQEGADITQTCLYAWSTDGACWTNWVSYSEYQRLASVIESDFYLRVLLFGSFDKISVNGLFTGCYNITLDTTNELLVDFCGNSNLFNPYANMDCALQLQQQMSNAVICMFGIPIYYFKVKPNADTADYTFKEYVMHNIESVKQIKLMIPDGQMPSSNPQFTDWDQDFELDFECEVGKTQFAQAFGDTAFPKQRDLVYVPMMHRMWEVNSAYDEKNEGLMWRPTTWKLGLVKYNDKTNVEQGEYEGLIDTLVINQYDDVFGILERNEQERQTSVAQLDRPTYAETNLNKIFLEDSVRAAMTIKDIQIAQRQLNHKSLVVTKNEYTPLNASAQVVYQKQLCSEEGMMFMIITPIGEASSLLFKAGEIEARYDNGTISFAGMSQALAIGETYAVFFKWSKGAHVTELNVYKHCYPDGIPYYKIRPEMCGFELQNAICEQTNSWNEDYNTREGQPVVLCGFGTKIAGFKYYNRYMNKVDSIREALKYATTCKECVINDNCRPLDDGHGYAVK